MIIYFIVGTINVLKFGTFFAFQKSIDKQCRADIRLQSDLGFFSDKHFVEFQH